MSTTEDNLATIRAAYDAFFCGDMEKFFAYYDDDIVLVEADSLPYAGTYRGRAAARRLVETVAESWENLNLDIKSLTAGDDYVIAFGQFSAVGKATGKFTTFALAEVWRLRDGRIIYLHPVYGDTKSACEALGAGGDPASSQV